MPKPNIGAASAPDDAAQSQRFVATAREAEADETADAMESAFARIVKTGLASGKDRTAKKPGGTI